MQRPSSDEYAEYYGLYVDRVPEGDAVAILADEIERTIGLVEGLDEDRALHRYAPGKWSVKEVVGHMVDTERMFGIRGLAFARGEPSELFDYDQEIYVRGAGFDARPLSSLIEEWRALRASHVALFASLDDETSRRRGRASGCEFTVRTMPWLMVGHERHHRGVLVERYLS